MRMIYTVHRLQYSANTELWLEFTLSLFLPLSVSVPDVLHLEWSATQAGQSASSLTTEMGDLISESHDCHITPSQHSRVLVCLTT